jgi:hypothetical protein
MSNYNYHVLSPTEFENLARDLIQKKENIVLESFKEGKDSGIDMRYAQTPSKTTIVQAKRYIDDYANLYSKLKSDELPKVKKLKPKRYILVTSVGLTPLNKSNIQALFSGYIKNQADIIGKDDLDNLLGLYPDIEKAHFKLWLTSTAIMQQILRSKEFNQSAFEFHAIADEIKLYVPNGSFQKSKEIIKRENFVVISGVPGIGKTTLARMLAFNYLAEGYEDFIYVSGSIDDAMSLYVQGKKQIFLYDDFLGGNFLSEKLSKNEDRRIINFIRQIKKDKDKILIMTTREYILRQAESSYPLLEELRSAQATVELEEYTSLVRAQILYNHLFFNRIPREFFENILDNDNYRRIIDHENYSPRIISAVISDKFWEDVKPESFTDEFVKYLDKPDKIWENVFETKISPLSQFILKILAIADAPILVEDLRMALKKHTSFTGPQFKHSLRELENTFIVLQADHNGDIAIEFQNNSILDYLLEYLRTNRPELTEMLEKLAFISHGFDMFELPDSMLLVRQQHRYTPIKHDEDTLEVLRNTLSDHLLKLRPSTKLYKHSKTDGHFLWKKNAGQIEALIQAMSLFNLEEDIKFKDALLDIVSRTDLSTVEIDRDFSYVIMLIYETRVYLHHDINGLIRSCATKVDSFDSLSAFCELARTFPEEFMAFSGTPEGKKISKDAYRWCEQEFAKGIAPSINPPPNDFFMRIILKAEMERICEEINAISRSLHLGIYVDPEEHKELVRSRLKKNELIKTDTDAEIQAQEMNAIIRDLFRSL